MALKNLDMEAMLAKIKDRLGWLDVTKTIDLERLIALQNHAFEPKPTHVVLHVPHISAAQASRSSWQSPR